MSVQLVLLKSGEELVADVRELVDRTTGDPITTILIKPVRVTVVQQAVLTEGASEPSDSLLSLVPWLATSKSEEYFIKPEWIVTVCDPQDNIKQSYIQNVGVRDDSENCIVEEWAMSDSRD
tara:strand:- start:221 stop:583 length:363 start_codon:yes stop_codon:yes gene_type:complete